MTIKAEDFQPAFVLQGQDQQEAKFPFYFKYLSGYVQKELAKRPVESSTDYLVELPQGQRDIPSDLLKQLVDIVECVQGAARTNFGTPVTPVEYNDKTIFINAKVKQSSHVILEKITTPKQLTALFNYTFTLEVPILTNLLASVIADRMFSEVEEKIFPLKTQSITQLKRCLNQKGFQIDQIVPLKHILKYLYLSHLGVEEQTLGDYIGLHGQPAVYHSQYCTLNLSKKKLTSLSGVEFIENPEDIEELHFSKNLLLGNNVDPYFSNDAFSRFKNAALINLQYNKISSFPRSSFAGMDELRVVMADYNQLKTLPEDSFRNSPRLARVNVSHNQIETLPTGIFHNIPNLSEITLNHNQLKSFPRNCFDLNPKLHVTLWSNPVAKNMSISQYDFTYCTKIYLQKQ